MTALESVPRREVTPQARRQHRKQMLTVLAFMSPWILGFLIFTLYPMISSLYFSFTRYDLLGKPKWVGLHNYQFMFTQDVDFWLSVRNTLWIVVVAIPIRVVFAILTAMLLVRANKAIKIYRTMFFLPSIAPAVAASLAFVFLLNPVYGPVNQLLSKLGVANPPLWFQDPNWSKPGLVLLGLWGIGDTMIIFLAGLLDVPRQLYEAADIEGAGGWQKFRYITLPMISPVIFFSVITGIIGSFQYFTEAFVTSSQVGGLGAPEGSLLFYATHLYDQGFQSFRMGYASALAWVLLVVTLIFTLLIFRGSKRFVFYQGGMFR
jgi:multiple sugar transport system permease protein